MLSVLWGPGPLGMTRQEMSSGGGQDQCSQAPHLLAGLLSMEEASSPRHHPPDTSTASAYAVTSPSPAVPPELFLHIPPQPGSSWHRCSSHPQSPQPRSPRSSTISCCGPGGDVLNADERQVGCRWRSCPAAPLPGSFLTQTVGII